MADCRWADPQAAPPGTSAVPLGQQYALRAGLMEISYDSGAKVILQGPCTYEVDSPSGGFLSLGKLTARVEKRGRRKGRGQKSGIRNQKSLIPYPFPLSPSSSSALPPPPSPIWAPSSASRSTAPAPPGRTSSRARSNCGWSTASPLHPGEGPGVRAAASDPLGRERVGTGGGRRGPGRHASPAARPRPAASPAKCPAGWPSRRSTPAWN